MDYIFMLKVVALQFRTRALPAVHDGNEWKVPREPLGWFVRLEGIQDFIWISNDKPTDIHEGQDVELILRVPKLEPEPKEPPNALDPS